MPDESCFPLCRIAFVNEPALAFDREEKVLIDVKGLFAIDRMEALGLRWWRL